MGFKASFSLHGINCCLIIIPATVVDPDGTGGNKMCQSIFFPLVCDETLHENMSESSLLVDMRDHYISASSALFMTGSK